MRALLALFLALSFHFYIASVLIAAPLDEPLNIRTNESTTTTTTESYQSPLDNQSNRSGPKKSDSGSPTELPDFTSFKNTSTFSCHGRITGYYADVKLNCRVYHFCTLIDSIGETKYQRMSYICLEGSTFDQKDLNCVKDSDLKVPCNKAEAEFESSNKQFDNKEPSSPSMSDNLAANIMMNPITRFIAGR